MQAQGFPHPSHLMCRVLIQKDRDREDYVYVYAYLHHIQYLVYIYILVEAFPLCPGVSWPPLPTIRRLPSFSNELAIACTPLMFPVTYLSIWQSCDFAVCTNAGLVCSKLLHQQRPLSSESFKVSQAVTHGLFR